MQETDEFPASITQETKIKKVGPALPSSPERQIKQERIIGQRSAIRHFNPDDPVDIQRLRRIVDAPETQRWMLEVADMSDQDLIMWTKEQGNPPFEDKFLFAVSGAQETVSRGEIGEAQGFVYLYSSPKEQVRTQRVATMLAHSKRSDKFDLDFTLPGSEVSFARLPDAPERQIASGLRQACVEVNKRIVRRQYQNHENSGPDITTLDDEEPEKIPKPHLPVVAFVDPDNEVSINVLKAAGFEDVGRMMYNNQSKKEDVVYVLNWAKLNEILHQYADEVLFR